MHLIDNYDFASPRNKADMDKNTLEQKGIKSPELGKYRVKKGNAIFFFKTRERMENSVIHTDKFKNRGMDKCFPGE